MYVTVPHVVVTHNFRLASSVFNFCVSYLKISALITCCISGPALIAKHVNLTFPKSAYIRLAFVLFIDRPTVFCLLKLLEYYTRSNSGLPKSLPV
jgi:hypothetical protein